MQLSTSAGGDSNEYIKDGTTASTSASAKSSASVEGAAKLQRPPSRGRLGTLWEDAKDVLAVTFGITRHRNAAADYASGARVYPWTSYVEPGTGRTLYRNAEANIVTEVQPPDWALFATDASILEPNVDAHQIATIRPVASRWEKTLAAVANTPIIAAVAAAGRVVAASPVGAVAAAVRDRVRDDVEDLREKWETSQHP